MQTSLVSIFISRLRKFPKAKHPLKNKPPDKKSFKKYQSPLDHWRAIIKSVLLQQKEARMTKRQKFQCTGFPTNVASRRSSRTSPISKYKLKVDKCSDRSRRASIMALFPATGRSVFYKYVSFHQSISVRNNCPLAVRAIHFEFEIILYVILSFGCC